MDYAFLLRDYAQRPQYKDAADALNGAASEIERLRTALDDALDDRRTQYMTPEERAKRQDALNAAMRNALENAALVRPNVLAQGREAGLPAKRPSGA